MLKILLSLRSQLLTKNDATIYFIPTQKSDHFFWSNTHDFFFSIDPFLINRSQFFIRQLYLFLIPSQKTKWNIQDPTKGFKKR
jgi:CMP-N-acetylneuraminic acid synthetase